MSGSRSIQRFWSKFLKSTGRDPNTRYFDLLYSDDREASAEDLVLLVLSGQKTALSALEWEYEVEGRRLPRPGDLSLLATWDDTPICVIETTAVEVVPFEEVDADFAAAEGEGDDSLEQWRADHWDDFERTCGQIGRTPCPRMPVVCQRFRVVHEHRAVAG